MSVMSDGFYGALLTFGDLLSGMDHLDEFMLKFFPFVLILELPFYLMIVLGVLKNAAMRSNPADDPAYFPRVSCGLLCYAEGKAVQLSIRSLVEQIYPGHIEILVVIDGAIQNHETTAAVMEMKNYVAEHSNRSLVIVPKRQRGGRVSSLNTILEMNSGEIVMALDGDTSFDNIMVRAAVRHFHDPNVVAVAGNLRVRNARASIIAGLQAIEYMLAIHLSKIALSEFNVVNNVSGAFGIFRTTFLRKIGGWDAGTAEDLDLTTRIKGYFGRYPSMRIVFEPDATGHTDAPETLRQFLDQRLRWDGDLFWLYMRKHWMSFNPRLLGWKNFLVMTWVGPFFQILTPFLILSYLVFSFIVFEPHQVWGVLFLIYSFYLLVTLALYTLYIVLVSDRPKADLGFVWLLPLFPLFTFMTRIWAAVSSLTEMFLYSSRDTSMAPWWVTKKSRF